MLIHIFAVADIIWTGLIAAVSAPVAALLIGRQLNSQRKAEKNEDYLRQDKVAARAEEARVALAEDNKRVADEAARQQEQVAAVARDAADLLLKAQTVTRSDADEVARIAAEKAAAPESVRREKLLAVVISHPSGVQRVIELDGVPSKGEHIILKTGRQGDQPQRVVDVLWVEANGGRTPSVIVVVCPTELSEKTLKETARAVKKNDDKHDDL